MALMKDFRRNSRDGRWGLPTIIVQTPQARYRPPQNPAGCLQIMQAINVTNDQVQLWPDSGYRTTLNDHNSN